MISKVIYRKSRIDVPNTTYYCYVQIVIAKNLSKCTKYNCDERTCALNERVRERESV